MIILMSLCSIGFVEKHHHFFFCLIELRRPRRSSVKELAMPGSWVWPNKHLPLCKIWAIWQNLDCDDMMWRKSLWWHGEVRKIRCCLSQENCVFSNFPLWSLWHAVTNPHPFKTWGLLLQGQGELLEAEELFKRVLRGERWISEWCKGKSR